MATTSGERATFADHQVDVKGCNDLLLLTQPHIIGGIHREYLEAGADILETCTFNSTSVSMADYEMQRLVYDLNEAGAKLARGLCNEFSTPDKPRFVAGVLGPTGRTASISPDVNDPGARNVTFDELVESYTEAIRGLLDGGADILMVETIFDTLNAKAALFAIERYFEQHKVRVPIMISGTITDASGPNAVRPDHRGVLEFLAACPPAFHRPQLRTGCGTDAALCGRTVARGERAMSARTPTPACPIRLSETGYDELPEKTARLVKEFATSGFLNIAGGCCGTSPAHIKAIAEALKDVPPRKTADSKRSVVCPGWSRSTSATIRCSSTSASAPTSPVRPSSSASFWKASTTRRWKSPSSRWRPARR